MSEKLGDKIVCQMMSFQHATRSPAFAGSLADVCKMLREKTPDRFMDIHYVLVIFSNYDDPDSELSKEFPLTVRQFLYVYGSYDEPEVKLDG